MNLIIDIVLFAAVVVLIWPQPIKTTIRRIAPFLMVGAVILGGFVIVGSHGDNTVAVKALNEKNNAAEGSEIRIRAVVIDGVEHAPEDYFSQGWLSEDGCLKWRNYDQPEGMSDTIYATFPKDADTDILFETNKWRGVAQVTQSGLVSFVYDVDCYSESEDNSNILSYQVAKSFSGMRVAGKMLFFSFVVLISILAFVSSLFGRFRRESERERPITAAPREVWLDALKALAAPMIVLIHTVGTGYSGTPLESGKWIGYLVLNALPRFAVPIFIMISGVLLIGKKMDGKKIWSNTKKALLLLVVWNVFYILLQAILWGPEEPIWKQILSLPVKRGPSGHLWYAHFLVWLYLFSPIVNALYQALSRRMRLYFVTLTVLIPGVLDFYLKTLDITSASALYAYQLYMTLNYIGIMFLGRMIYERALTFKHIDKAFLISAMLGLAGMITITCWYSRSHGQATDMFMSETQLLSVLFSSGLLGFAAEHRNAFNRIPQKLKQAIEWLSRHAIGIYFIHVFNIWTIGKSPDLGLIELAVTNNIWQALLLCLIYYIASVFEVALLDRIPYLRRLVT